MITYRSSAFGIGLLLRLHGSAAAKAIMPAVFSTVVMFVMYYASRVSLSDSTQWRVDTHPAPITSLLSAFTFLLVFRANFSYNRYWEAAGAVYQMMSKWIDVGIEMGAFHYQASGYDSLRPPSFGKHQNLKSVVRERERHNVLTMEEMEEELEEHEPGFKTRMRAYLGMPKAKKIRRRPPSHSKSIGFAKKKLSGPQTTSRTNPSFLGATGGGSLSSVGKLHSVSRLDGGMSDQGNPSLFLQELCHLVSLLNAVAMSTLRNDVEHASSPLCEYVPGEPWPPSDPDQLSSDVRQEYHEHHTWVTILLYVLGRTRRNTHRTLYNAARPFRVLGGVSDAECQLLQDARGPYAKVALCSFWLQEFISREYMNGSTGNVAPPIISRLYQYTSDGMVGYNQARKIAFVPFPFPHAQLTSFFVFVICFVIPVLNLSWGVYIWFAAILNFFTVLCFAGIHEVARELENPFQNTPNDLPLTTYQAQLNEALVTMYSGYHPDAFWTVAAAKDTNNSIAVKAKNNLCTVAESNGEESDKGAENAPPTKAVTSNGNKVITIVQG